MYRIEDSHFGRREEKKGLHVIICTPRLKPSPRACSGSQEPGFIWAVDDVDPGGEGATLGPTRFR